MAESDKVINAVMKATGESYEKVSTFTSSRTRQSTSA